MEIAENGRHPAHVVIMSVSHRNNIEVFDRPAPQVRRNDVFSDIDVGLSVVAEHRNATSIHQHELAIREGDQQAIALAYVNRHEFEPVLGCLGRKWIHADQRKCSSSQRTRNQPPAETKLAPGRPDERRGK